MQLLLIGASHGVGFELLQQTLQAGHDITLIARSPDHIELGRASDYCWKDSEVAPNPRPVG
jgi:short-subunit dehydrogenase